MTSDTLYNLSNDQKLEWSISKMNFRKFILRVHFTGRVEQDRLKHAVTEVALRHEALRLRFIDKQDLRYPVFAISESPEVVMNSYDFTHFDVNEQEKGLTSLINSLESSYSGGNVINTCVVKSDKDKYVFLLAILRIVSDSRSVRNIMQEIAQVYNHQSLVPVNEVVSFTQYAEWIKSISAPEEVQEFWNRNIPSYYTNLPLCVNNPDKGSEKSLFYKIDHETCCLITKLAEELKVEREVVFLACWFVLIHWHSPSESVNLFVINDGREYQELLSSIGMLSNVLPVQVNFTGKDALTDLVRKVTEDLNAKRKWQRYSSSFLHPQLEQRENKLPLGFEYLSLGSIYIPDLKSEVIRQYGSHCLFQLKLTVQESESGFGLSIIYNTSSYELNAIDIILNQYLEILRRIPDLKKQIPDVPFISSAEKELILKTYNQIPESPISNTIVDLFEDAAGKFQWDTAIALQNKKLTYREVERTAESLAGFLQIHHKVGPGSVVGVLLNSSDWLVITILAILKTGAAYVPLVHDFPQDLKNYVLKDSKCDLLICDEHEKKAAKCPVLLITDFSDRFSVNEYKFNKVSIDPESLVYIMYTSGSSGSPKGVKVKHSNLTNYLTWANKKYFSNSRGFHFALFTPITFDLTITSLFTTLLRGDTLFIPENDSTDRMLLKVFGGGSGINTVKMTPSHVGVLEFLDLTETKVNTVILGGEQIKEIHLKTLKRLNPEIRIFNEYGPTETTVGCTAKETVNLSDLANVGSPADNTRIYILNKYGSLCPVGVGGEICVAGYNVSMGYNNNQDLTNKKFVQWEGSQERAELVYKTGDTGLYNAAGEIIYIGRNDRQFKLNGFRIEPGHIEEQLGLNPSVKSSHVCLRELSSGENTIVAYVVTQSGITETELNNFLKERIPKFMMPSHCIFLEKIPLTLNGKVSIAELPHPDELKGEPKFLNNPVDDIERDVLELCKEVLKKIDLSLSDDFFKCGGTSLKVIEFVGKINKHYSNVLKVGDLYNNSLIGQIAGFIKKKINYADKNREFEEFEI